MRIIGTGLLVACVGIGGCATPLEDRLFSGYAAKPLDSKDALISYTQLQKALLLSTDQQTGLVPGKCFAIPVASADRGECALVRNQTVAIMAIASNSLCQQHRQTIYGREATANVTLGTLTSLFAGSAAVASSRGAKTLYSALSLFFNSERSLVNETVYKTMIVTAVDQKIVESMEAKATALKPRLNQDIDQYPIQQAIDDMVDIHSACSFMNGLRLALAEGTQATNAKKVITLRQALASVEIDIRNNCTTPPAAAGTPGDLICTQTRTRMTAISDALKIAQSMPN